MKMNVRNLETVNLRGLMIFATSCQTLNLTQCAEMLGIPKSTVSKEITKLEQHFNTKLLERSTRNVYITESGKIVYQHAMQMMDSVKTLHDDVRTMEEQVQGLIQISAPPVLGEVISTSLIPEFLSRWPKTSIRLNLSYSFENLFSEGLDLALRVGKVHDDRLVSKQIGMSARYLVASPGYIKVHGQPETPAALSQHNCLRFTFHHGESEWSLTSNSDTQVVLVNGNFFCPSIPALRQVTLQGSGIAQLPISAIREDLQTGNLIRVLPEWRVPPNPIYAMYRSGLNKPKKLQAMLNFLEEKKDIFSLSL
ncbi:LysR family transcriptional regulator [Aestuariibacter sp. AA17]|uniref:LysR family transcriptional regulator n=1 Tax=Fluctibacter corallii TaxID=2984329 RepID=A0ABT3A3Z8_9ALTE|nr:LysR family transcriptional regulator [Aestuariibacter sp. AA17]MCV2883409.1 LysR family transcriptional regulator [Aestuariibacter sp. AA17]